MSSLVLEEALEDVPDERSGRGHAHRRRRLRSRVPRPRVHVIVVIVQLGVVRSVVLVVIAVALGLDSLPPAARLPPLLLVNGCSRMAIFPISPRWGFLAILLLFRFVAAVFDEILHERGVHEEELLDVALFRLLIRVDLECIRLKRLIMIRAKLMPN